MIADVTTTQAELLGLGSATLAESGATPLAPRIRPIWTGARVAAPAFAVSSAPGDNLALHVATTAAPPGTVLVADVGSIAERGYWGEVLTVASQTAGIVGLVIDGCVRDTAALAHRQFPVFARGIALPGASKDGPGAVGGDATVGGVSIRSGDWLVADEDGIVVVAEDRLEEVLQAGQRRRDRESTMFERLGGGSTTVRLLDIDTRPVTRIGPGGDDSSAATPAATVSLPAPAGVISTPTSPVPSGAYSQGRSVADLVFVAGVGPYDPVTRGIVGDEITTQTDQAMRNVEAILVAAGLDLSSVVASTVYLAELGRDWTAFDAAYGRYFAPPFPTRAVVGAALKGILVEIVVTASRSR